MGALRGLSELHGTAVERWFAAQGPPPRLDLARSGAAPVSIAEVLRHGDPSDLEALLNGTADYGDGRGELRLRRAVADSGSARSSDEVLVTHGAAEALLLACAAAATSPGHAIVGGPAYGALVAAPRAVGLRTHVVPVWDPEADQLVLSGLTDAVTSRTRVVLVNSPHNPSGAVAPRSDLESLARRCEEVGAILVVDEVSVATSSPSAPSGVHMAGFDRGAVVICGDVSKSMGLGGLRVGWLTTASPELLTRAAALKDVTSVANAVPTQLVAAVALEHRAAMVAPTARWARANLVTLLELTARCRGLLIPPLDGLVALPRLPLGRSAVSFAALVRRDAGVAVAPGSLFGCPDRLRFGLGCDPRDFARGADRIEAAVRAA